MSKNHDKTILVTGATGHQGGASLRHLRERGFEVRALTRDPERPEARALSGPRTEIVRGDLSDASSISRAVDGVYGVHSVQDSTQGFDQEVRQGRNLADAANRMRISHLVYSSVASADGKTGIPHFESKAQIEQHIRNTGLRYTIFRPVFFMENLLQMKDLADQGTLALPLKPETRLQLVAVDDIGAFVAQAFERPGHWANQVMELAGDELSMREIAQSISRVGPQPVQYQQVAWDEFERRVGKDHTLMFRWFERVGYHVDISSVRKEHPPLMNLDRWLDANWRGAQATRKAGS